MPLVDSEGRPVIDHALLRLVDELAMVHPTAFGHIKATNILFVAGSARRQARASIRPFGLPEQSSTLSGPRQQRSSKPVVTVDGRRILYEICLRPRFFQDATAEERIHIVAHELWHISPSFDGSLAPQRRHGSGSRPQVDQPLKDAVAAWQEHTGMLAPSFLAVLGELRIQAWMCRPPSHIPIGRRVRRTYTENDLYSAIVEQTKSCI